MFLSLLPPSTRAQCLAMKIAFIMELLAFADYVYCQLTVTATVVAIDLELVTEDILNNSAAWLKRQKIYKNLPKNPLNKGNIFEAACFVLHRF